jgi:membrane protein YdbS with pleckstrin-like domain
MDRVGKFKPSPLMKTLFYYYLAMITLPLWALAIAVTAVVYVYASPLFALIPALCSFTPLALATIVTLYWIPRYYDSLTFELAPNEVRVEGGVWWKMRHAVPFSRIMSLDTIQGPLSRRLGIGTVDIYTAGYTGVSGGTGGPGTRRAEASIVHVADFIELRENILRVVGGRSLFSAPKPAVDDVGQQMLSELKEIKELLSKRA